MKNILKNHLWKYQSIYSLSLKTREKSLWKSKIFCSPQSPSRTAPLKWQQTSAVRANWWLQCSSSSFKCLWWVKWCKRGWAGSTAVQTWGRAEVTLNRWEQQHLISYCCSGKKTQQTFVLDAELTVFCMFVCFSSAAWAKSLKRTRGEKMGAKCHFC